jgi:hypothetical protein
MEEHLDYAEQVVDTNACHKFTRAHGLLEPFLARQRATIANRVDPARIFRYFEFLLNMWATAEK